MSTAVNTETSTWVVELPDGTDTTKAPVRARVEARVRATWGPHAVIMWPRHPDFVDGIPERVPVVDARPWVTTHRLGAATKGSDAPSLAVTVRQNGLGELIEFDLAARVAVCAHVDPETLRVRDRLAALLGKPSHEVEVATHTVVDPHTGLERLDQVVVLRTPTIGVSPEKRKQVWAELAFSIPGGSAGWEVLDDPVTGQVRLRYGQPRTLPGLVSMADLLPLAIDTSNWARLALGVDPTGREACINLTDGPHTLVVGPTGSGKSVYLRQHAIAALTHGHQLIVIDPVKSGLDFLAFKPWCVAFGDEGIEEARALIETVYAEGMRRKALLRVYEAPSWVDLPPEVRQKENVHPLTVLFDEFMSAVIASPVPKGLDKDDPLVEEANRMNAAKAVILAMVGKIARELRFTGVFLAIAMQRPDASLLAGFGEIRSNLTSAVQLVKPGSLPAQETLRMVYPGEQTQVAADTIMELDDGTSKGLATIAAEGGDVQGFRVGFGTPAEIPVLLEALGVPQPTKWAVTGREPEPAPFTPIEPVRLSWGTQTPEPEVFDVSMDDLVLDDGEDDFAPAPPVFARPPADDDDFAPAPPVKPSQVLPDDIWD